MDSQFIVGFVKEARFRGFNPLKLFKSFSSRMDAFEKNSPYGELLGNLRGMMRARNLLVPVAVASPMVATAEATGSTKQAASWNDIKGGFKMLAYAGKHLPEIWRGGAAVASRAAENPGASTALTTVGKNLFSTPKPVNPFSRYWELLTGGNKQVMAPFRQFRTGLANNTLRQSMRRGVGHTGYDMATHHLPSYLRDSIASRAFSASGGLERMGATVSPEVARAGRAADAEMRKVLLTQAGTALGGAGVVYGLT